MGGLDETNLLAIHDSLGPWRPLEPKAKHGDVSSPRRVSLGKPVWRNAWQ